jgi:hypothetical protein
MSGRCRPGRRQLHSQHKESETFEPMWFIGCGILAGVGVEWAILVDGTVVVVGMTRHGGGWIWRTGWLGQAKVFTLVVKVPLDRGSQVG